MCLSLKVSHNVYNYYETNFYWLLKSRPVLPPFPKNKDHREVKTFSLESGIECITALCVIRSEHSSLGKNVWNHNLWGSQTDGQETERKPRSLGHEGGALLWVTPRHLPRKGPRRSHHSQESVNRILSGERISGFQTQMKRGLESTPWRSTGQGLARISQLERGPCLRASIGKHCGKGPAHGGGVSSPISE